MTVKEVDAVYEHGVFRPTDPQSLDLADGQKVRLVVEPLERVDARLAPVADVDDTQPDGKHANHGDWASPDPDVDRAMEAYIAMHPRLMGSHAGQYVAIYQGRLIDHDDELSQLLARIEKQYPDEFVWLTRVEPEAIPALTYRSPRFSRN